MTNIFYQLFGRMPQYRFAAPGRTELSGNHTDHQHGCVLAAAVDLKTTACVAENGLHVIRVQSEGYSPVEVDLNDLSIHEEEKNTTAALIRGVAAAFTQRGAQLRGFDAYCTSTVLPGSGLSSSAAFEVLFGTIFNHLFLDSRLSAIEIAQIGQYAENVYFGKPSGLMDQMACSVGNVVGIDFADPAKPQVQRLDFDFAYCGHTLCVIDSGADHANLTDAYASIPKDMGAVAAFFGKQILREVNEEAFYEQLPTIRQQCGDRAVLRAMHFFEENQRVQMQIRALENDNFDAFLSYVRQSGLSSWRLLQNVIPPEDPDHQALATALALAEHLLNGRGACRVHGGGFAGTLLAFVPNDMLESFQTSMGRMLGTGSVHVLSICPQGGIRLE